LGLAVLPFLPARGTFVSAWRFSSTLGPTKTKKVKAINQFFTIQNLSCHRFSGRWKFSFLSSHLNTSPNILLTLQNEKTS
jgi:hypothetical protein